MSTPVSNEWELQCLYPSQHATNLVQLNDHEFICGSFNVEPPEQRVLKFDTLKNEWMDFLILPKELCFSSSRMCFNQNNNTIYVAAFDNDYKALVIAINVKTKEYKKIYVSDSDDLCHLCGSRSEVKTWKVNQPSTHERQKPPMITNPR